MVEMTGRLVDVKMTVVVVEVGGGLMIVVVVIELRVVVLLRVIVLLLRNALRRSPRSWALPGVLGNAAEAGSTGLVHPARRDPTPVVDVVSLPGWTQ